jgi:hypothetical protein
MDTLLVSECPALVPPTYGYAAQRNFDISSQAEQIRPYINKVFDMYNSTGREDGHIRGIRFMVEFANGSVISTGIMEPTFMPSGDSYSNRMFIIRNADSDNERGNPDKMKMRTVSVIVSWNMDYINILRGKPQ